MLINSSAHALPLRDGIVHTIVTSPPYFGLRKYAGQQALVWLGGEYAPMLGAPPITIVGPRTPETLAACDHAWGEALPGSHPGQVEQTKWRIATAAGAGQTAASGQYCLTCGAWRGGFGSEPTPEMYIWHSLLILRECWRVLRADGVVWWNVGDSYMSAKGRYKNTPQTINAGQMNDLPTEKLDGRQSGWTDGQLIGIPHRLMLAAQSDGWTVRNDVVWAKRSCMPESVNGWRFERQVCACVGNPTASPNKTTDKMAQGLVSAKTGLKSNEHEPSRRADPNCPQCGGAGVTGEARFIKGSWRHTRSHEFVLMLTKGTGYYANAELAKEKSVGVGGGGFSQNYIDARHAGVAGGPQEGRPAENGVRNPRNVMRAELEEEIVAQIMAYEVELLAALTQAGNAIDVVSPSPSNYSGAHYAVFPKELIAPLMRVTTPLRCCPQCGKGWAVVVEREANPIGSKWSKTENQAGYRPTCACHYGGEFLPDDFESVLSPTGEREQADPSLETGRAGFNRPRGEAEGARPLTRYEQRHYAEQIKASPHRSEMQAQAGGKTTIAHYIRTDKSGARPIPPNLLEAWIEAGWLKRVTLPEQPEPLAPVPGLILDPFFGSGTTGLAAKELGLRFVGADISDDYLLQQAQVRAMRRTPEITLKDLPLFALAGMVDEERNTPDA